MLRPQLLALLVLVAVSRVCAYINDWVPSGVMRRACVGQCSLPAASLLTRPAPWVTPLARLADFEYHTYKLGLGGTITCSEGKVIYFGEAWWWMGHC